NRRRAAIIEWLSSLSRTDLITELPDAIAANSSARLVILLEPGILTVDASGWSALIIAISGGNKLRPRRRQSFFSLTAVRAIACPHLSKNPGPLRLPGQRRVGHEDGVASQIAAMRESGRY